MKRFVFKYQRIFQVRIDFENELKNNLGQINKTIFGKEQELSDAKGKNDTFLVYVEESMRAGMRAADLQSIEHNKEYLSTKIFEIKYQIRTLVSKRVDVQKDLVEANKQRKIMEKLKEKEYAQYLELAAAEEAKVIDQIVTYNSTRKRGE